MNYKRLFAKLMSAVLFMTAAALPAEAKQEKKTIEAVTGEAAIAQAAEDTNDVQAVTDTTTFELPIEVKFCQTEARSELDMINELRTGEDAWYWNEDDTEKIVFDNLEEIRYDYALEKVAMQRAVEAAIYYSHTRPNGGRFFTAYNDLGYSWRNCGENVAAGYRTASAVFTGWAEENEAYAGQGHRRNMLNADFKAVGCACVYYEGYYYWVQNFSNAVADGQETAANDSISIEKAVVSNSNAGTWSLTPESLDIFEQQPYELSDLITVNYKLAVAGWSPQQKERKSMLKPAWTAEDTTILNIENGVLTGLKSGTSKITAITPDGNSTLSETVNVISCILINSRSVELEEKINARIYVYVPDSELETTYITTTFNGTSKTEYAKTMETAVRSGRTCRLVTVDTFAKQMRDDIVVKVHEEDGTPKYLEYEGEDVTDGYVFHIEDYVKSVEEKATDEKLIDLVRKMNWYGLYAQKQFNYNPVEFEEPAVITNFNDAVLSDYAVQNTGTAEGIKYTSGSLQLDSDTGIKVNYTLTGTDTISDYTFTVDGTAVQPKLVSGKKYYVTYKGIPAKKLNEWHTVTVTDKAGNTLTTKYCGLTYTYSVVSNASAPDTLKDLCRSIYLYWEAAYNYFPKQ